MRFGKRAAAAVLLALGLGAAGAGAASAIDIPNPIGDAILDKICPPRQAPYPASPSGPVVKRGGGAGLYANYDYAGLRWTTYDAGCLSWDKADTSIGTQINAAANAVDQLINEVQIAALDDATTAAFDVVIERALVGLRDAFWNTWSMLGLAVVGLLIAGYAWSGRETDMLTLAGTALLVVAALSLLMMRPHLPAQVGNGMTSGVAQGVADSLIKVTPGNAMPASASAVDKFGEGFYQVSYRAWLEGSFCGDASAERIYGRPLLDSQAFTVQQLRAIEGDPGKAKALVEAKQKAWLAIGEQMQQTHPAAFGCWKGEGTSRTAAAVKHAVVTLSAGFWIILGSVALLALKWVLRLALLFFVTFGALMLFSRRMQDRMTEFVLLGLLGPPFVAAGVGTMLWGYYAILGSDQAWWQAGVAAFALGLAVWFAKGILQRIFIGIHSVGRSGTLLRKGGRTVSSMTHRTTNVHAPTSGTSGAAAAAAGAAAGVAATHAVARHTGDDGRRDEVQHDTPAEYTPPPNPEGRPQVYELQEPDNAAAEQALARVRQMAAKRQPGDDDAGRLVDDHPWVQPTTGYVVVDDHSGDDRRDD